MFHTICKIWWTLYGYTECFQELDLTHIRLETTVVNDDVLDGNCEIMKLILSYTLDDDPTPYHSAIMSCIKNN